MYREMLLTASMVLLLGAAPAYAADKEEFVKKATQSGDFEITSSELAQEQGAERRVERFRQDDDQGPHRRRAEVGNGLDRGGHQTGGKGRGPED